MNNPVIQPVVNVAVHLSRRAQETPYHPAIYFPAGRDSCNRVTYTLLTYAQLDRDSTLIGRGLLASGFEPGMRVVLMVKPSPEFFALTFGLLKSGIVPIMVDPGMGAANLKACLEDAKPHGFIGIPKAHIARVLMRWGKKTISRLITVNPGVYCWGDPLDTVKKRGSHEPFFTQTPEGFNDPFGVDDVAAVNFTSGSTGIPKGAVYTHGIFTAQVDLIRDTYGIAPGEIDLCTFPLFALFAPALGMTAIIPDMDFTRPATVNPLRIVEAMNDFGPSNMFGSPALLNRVGLYCQEHEITFPSLKRVICAGAPINPTILRRFTTTLTGDAQVFSGYGATEAMPLASIGSTEILADTCHGTDTGKGVCVGTANTGMNLRVIDITDSPIEHWSEDRCLPAGKIGEITVGGDVVTQSYFNRDEATRAAKMLDSETGRYRHRMGDLGWFDDQNRLWFCGRKSHRLETVDGPMFTIPVEGVFNAVPEIYRTALVGLGALGSQLPVLCIELEKEHQALGNTADTRQKLFQELHLLAGNHPHTQTLNRFIIHPGFPVDIRHNSKIFREKLRIWIAENERHITQISSVNTSKGPTQ